MRAHTHTRYVLTHGPNWALPGGPNTYRDPTSIGAHANLCMLGTLNSGVGRCQKVGGHTDT